MTANRTHRTRLARELAKTAPMPYQKALAHVVACGEAGLLPAKLDREGMDEALVLLQQYLKERVRPVASRAPEPAAPTAAKVAMSKDPRCLALMEALLPVLESSCPEGAGGYGGSLQANLMRAEAQAFGGVPLIRAALRRAGRQLGWRVQTLGHESEHVAMVAVYDTRQLPAEFADAMRAERRKQGTEAAERVSAVPEGRDLGELGPGPVDRQTALFRAAARAVLAPVSGT